MRSNAAQGKKRRNPSGGSRLGRLAAFLARYRSLRTCASLMPCDPLQLASARTIPVFQQSPKAKSSHTQSLAWESEKLPTRRITGRLAELRNTRGSDSLALEDRLLADLGRLAACQPSQAGMHDFHFQPSFRCVLNKTPATRATRRGRLR